MSSGKVKCTCGWSWNKSDSSKKDMYVCHECGRDNSNNMKNGGWLDSYADGGTMQEHQENYNDASVSLPEGFVGDGYNTKGRNYSPAWGGQFQMGGSIPGSVGFSYARTQSPAPSNGKYAKKTMASAQDGKNVEYDYVNYGTPEYKKAYEQGQFAELTNPLDEVVVTPYDKQFPYYQQLTPSEQKYLRENINSNDPISRQLKARAVDSRGLDADKATDFAKAWAIDLPLSSLQVPQSALVEGVEGIRGNDFNMLNALDPSTQKIPSETWGIENPYAAFAVDAITDPEILLGMSLLKQPLQKGMQQAGRYLTEETALNTLPKAKNFREALGTFRGIPTERSLPRLSPEELKAYRQVQEIGRMKATNKPVSEQYRYALQQNIPDEHFEKVFGRSKSEVEQILPSVAEQESIRSSIPIRERFNLERTPRRRSFSDAAIDEMNSQVNRNEVIRHRLTDYGSDADIERLLERTYNRNELRPIPEELFINTGSNRGRTIINSQNPRLNLLETARDDWQRYVDNKVPTSEVMNNKFANIVSEYPYYKGPVLENVPSLSLSTSGNLKNVSKKVGDQSVSGISSGDVFTGSLNTSHNSYLPQIKQVFKYTDGTPQFLGYKPMNHLGFLSDFRYSQDDIAKYLNTEIDQQISRGIIPKNIQRPYVTNKDRVILPHYGIKQFKEGGVIKDDRGQWEHPGEITEIGSNQITMEGVPYDVLGISDTGDTKLMKPGKNYKFKGKKVTEFPMAKNGLRQEQKGLQNLDNLTNFTNYNKPQPGGWLNKYN